VDTHDDKVAIGGGDTEQEEQCDWEGHFRTVGTDTGFVGPRARTGITRDTVNVQKDGD
jgi:hypothetical protein